MSEMLFLQLENPDISTLGDLILAVILSTKYVMLKHFKSSKYPAVLFRRVDEYVSVCLPLPVTLSGTDSCPEPLTSPSLFKPLLFITLLECILIEYALYLAFLMHKNALHNLQSVKRPRRKSQSNSRVSCVSSLPSSMCHFMDCSANWWGSEG